MPISVSIISPHCSAEAGIACSFLYESNANVTSAHTAPCAVSPVSAFTPLGRSSAATGVPVEFMSAHAFAPFSRSSPWNPVPYSASTATSALMYGRRAAAVMQDLIY